VNEEESPVRILSPAELLKARMEEDDKIDEEARFRDQLLKVLDEKAALEKKIRHMEGHGEGFYDVAVVVYTRTKAQDYRDAAALAEAQIRNALRDAAQQDPKTRTLFFSLERNGRVLGPVKLAHIEELERSAGNHSIKIQVSGAPYRYFERPPEDEDEV
jgi:hypothetical protein